MTNLFNLPRIDGANTSFAITFDSDWNDQIYVSKPGFSGIPLNLNAAITSGSNVITGLSSVDGLAVGSLIQGAGIPAGARIGALPSSSSVTIVDANNDALEATETLPSASFWFFPPPLDLTGISFKSQVRASLSSPSALLTVSTIAGTMVNSGTAGIFGYDVPAATLRTSALFNAVQAAGGQIDCVADITATDDSGAFLNLCEAAPFTVQVRIGATR